MTKNLFSGFNHPNATMPAKDMTREQLEDHILASLISNTVSRKSFGVTERSIEKLTKKKIGKTISCQVAVDEYFGRLASHSGVMYWWRERQRYHYGMKNGCELPASNDDGILELSIMLLSEKAKTTYQILAFDEWDNPTTYTESIWNNNIDVIGEVDKTHHLVECIADGFMWAKSSLEDQVAEMLNRNEDPFNFIYLSGLLHYNIAIEKVDLIMLE